MSEEKENNKSSVPNALYYAVATAIVKDDKYLGSLKTNPRAKIKEAAEKNQVSLTDEQLNSATQNVKAYLEGQSDSELKSSALSRYEKGPLVEIG